MDTTMQTQADATPARSRKRSVYQRDERSSDDELSPTRASAPDDTSPKRSRNSQGHAVSRRGPIYYDVQTLLYTLSFTQLLVTANYVNYNSLASPVILCITPCPGTLYRALCQLLPDLYGFTTGLQALAIVAPQSRAELQAATAGLGRVVPCSPTDVLREDVFADFESFRNALGGPEETVVLIGHDGRALWSSHDALSPDECHDEDLVRAVLQDSLAKTLSSRNASVAHHDADAMQT